MPEQTTLHEFVARVFGVAPEDIGDDSAPGSIQSWDSLGHVRLLTAIEDVIGCELDADDVMRLESVRDVRDVLRKHGHDWS